MNPLRQQVAAIGEVQKTVLLLTPQVLAARVRHVPPEACTAPALAAGVWREDGERSAAAGDCRSVAARPRPPKSGGKRRVWVRRVGSERSSDWLPVSPLLGLREAQSGSRILIGYANLLSRPRAQGSI